MSKLEVTGGINVEDCESIGGLVNGRRERLEILLAVDVVGKSIGGDRERHEDSGELRRRYEESDEHHSRFRRAVSVKLAFFIRQLHFGVELDRANLERRKGFVHVPDHACVFSRFTARRVVCTEFILGSNGQARLSLLLVWAVCRLSLCSVLVPGWITVNPYEIWAFNLG